MILRVDVQSPYGTNLGSGPIMTATDWKSVPRLDRAGDFSFKMPASDPRAALIQPRRYVRCYGLVGGTMTEIGAGIVDDIKVVGGTGPTMLEVSGNDLLRELNWRTCGTLYLNEPGVANPAQVYTLHISITTGEMIDNMGATTTDPTAAAFTTYPDAIDGNPGTWDAFEINGTWYRCYFCYSLPYNSINFTFHTFANTGCNFLTLQYFASSTTFTGWNNVAFSDGTATGANLSFHQNGSITFTPPADWVPYEQLLWNGSEYVKLTGYWVRLQGDDSHVGLNASVSEITVNTGVPTLNSLALPMAFAPAGWSLDAVSGYTTTGMPVYSVSQDETVMGCLTKISTLTFEHFRLGPGREVTWLRKTVPPSVIRCIRVTDGSSLGSNPLVAAITSLTYDTPTASLATRVIPYGAGTGPARLTLANTTRDTDGVNPLPGGYTFSRTNNQIINGTSEGTYGEVDSVQVWSNIGPFTTALAEQAPAANALWDVALYWLQVNSSPTPVYTLSVVGLQMAVLPGQAVHVTWLEIVDGYTVLNIDTDLVVLEATHQIDNAGIQTVGLVVSSQPVWPESDAEVLADALLRQHHEAAYPQPLDLSNVAVAFSPSGGSTMSTGSGGLYAR